MGTKMTVLTKEDSDKENVGKHRKENRGYIPKCFLASSIKRYVVFKDFYAKNACLNLLNNWVISFFHFYFNMNVGKALFWTFLCLVRLVTKRKGEKKHVYYPRSSSRRVFPLPLLCPWVLSGDKWRQLFQKRSTADFLVPPQISSQVLIPT